MKKEVVTLQFGQCGNQVGSQFWNILASEHGLTLDGKFAGDLIQQANIDLYFQESNTRYSPRAVLIDLEPAVVNEIKNRGHFYRNENCIIGSRSAANCFATGYTQNQGIEEEVSNIMRKEIENCQNIINFAMVHSVSGGVSGFAMKLNESIFDEFKVRCQNYTLYPSKDISSSITEGYNTLLCSNELRKQSDAIYVFDNQSLCDICTEIFKNSNASFYEYNRLITMFMTTMTSSSRFPTQHSMRPEKMLQILMPDNRLKYFIPSIAPLQNQRIMTPKSLVNEIFSKYALCEYDTSKLIISAALIYRGCHSTLDYDECLRDYLKKYEHNFTSWMPNNVTTSYCDIPLIEFSPQTVCRLTVGESMTNTFNQIIKNSEQLYKSGFGLMWYLDQGMTNEDFEQALESHRTLVEAYEIASGKDQ